MKPDHLIFKTDGSGDRWLAPDKARHLLASAFLCGAAFWTLHHHLEQSSRTSLKTAVLFTFSLGAAKEIRDSFAVKGCSSWKDLAADLAGIILGGILLAW